MGFQVNKIIASTTTITPTSGQPPTGVTLVFTDPNNTPHNVAVQLISSNLGWTYRGFFVPTIVGNWTRTWSGSNLLTSDSATLPVTA